MMDEQSEEIKFVHDIPYCERKQICEMLNENGKWAELAALMGYSNKDVSEIKKVDPCSELLTMWSHYNHTILELFALLFKMKHYQSMAILKPFVDKKYRRFISSRTQNSYFMGIEEQNFIENQSQISKEKKRLEEKIITEHFGLIKEQDLISTSNNLLVSAAALSVFSSSLPRINYKDLVTSTNCWNRSNLLGRGGFGTVFRGLWKNTEVAIKRVEKRGSDGTEAYAKQLQQSFTEIKVLNSTPHENILSLYAYSIDGEVPCLVYQYMPNGSLADRLRMKHGTPALTWKQRFEIAKGIARGLQYLHTIGNKPRIHGDIKSANILLDKSFEPKIGDFGLAKEGSFGSIQVNKIQGTRPYLPLEYLEERKLSTKVDTYSFGIVMYELATGLPANDRSRSNNPLLKDLLEFYRDRNRISFVMDKFAGEQDSRIFYFLVESGQWCASDLADTRPNMELAYMHIISYEENMLKNKNT